MAFSFGKTPAPATGGLFGAATPAPAPAGASGGFSFGAPAPVPGASGTQATSTFAGFGAAAAPVAPPSTTPAFGGGGVFGGGGLFGSSATSAPPQQHPQVPQLGAAAPAPAIDAGSASQREFEKLYAAYAEKVPGSNALNPDCRMKHVVYNQVDPSLRNSYTRPEHMDEKTWKKAEEDNPDPGKLAPAALIGWESLKERLLVQQNEMNAMAEKVALLRATAANGLRSVALVRTRMEASRRRHLAQAHRFLKIQRKLDAVRCIHKPLHDAERQLRVRLEGVHRALAPPQQMLKDLNNALLQGERQAEEVEEITDPEKLRRIFEALQGQREGLDHLMRIVKKDQQDLEIMMKPRALTQ